MSVLITPKGKLLLLKNIADLEQQLKQVRLDKNRAFHACGDDKLANPNFHKLEQDEQLLIERLREINTIYSTAKQIQLDKRNTEIVEIGSIVTCLFDYPGFTEEESYELVSYGESDIQENKLYYDSPIGQKLLGLKIGEQARVSVSDGIVKFTVLKLHESWEDVHST